MDIKVEYLVTIEPHRTESAFHCWNDGYQVLATVKSGDREFAVVSNGEMRINLTDGSVIRYTDDLLSRGIDTDEKYRNLVDTYENVEAWVNNNWFEFWEIGEFDSWEVYETVEEAIEAIKEILNGVGVA